MSLHYIVDGYNVLMRSGLFEQKRLQDARASFMAHLEHCRPHGSLRNRLSVVFDGRAEGSGFEGGRTANVIFTAGETADDKIKQMVERSSQPKNIVVVTDDKELGFFARRCGVRLMGVKEFLGQTRVRKGTDPTEGPNIVEREKITEELGRVWLREK